MVKHCNRCGLAIIGAVESDEAGSFHPGCREIPLLYDPQWNQHQTEVEAMFQVYPPRPDQVVRFDLLRAKAMELATLIIHFTPQGLPQTLALDALQTAVMKANACIVHHERGPR